MLACFAPSIRSCVSPHRPARVFRPIDPPVARQAKGVRQSQAPAFTMRCPAAELLRSAGERIPTGVGNLTGGPEQTMHLNPG
eukprot:gene15311-biopygen5186